ncbi:Imm45 family immunity protein [Agrobacterium cavarae]|uniref:Imm45 family immunity protein n=1 Tax=Agrobacterium cavarae TaxID=2528239 RepID=UPI003FD0E8FE
MHPKQKLIDLDQASLFRGNVLRLPVKYPFEERVDFMLFETRSGERGYGLMVTSGYKAGILLVYLPPGSQSKDGGVSRDWIASSWKAPIYPDCDVSQVEFIEAYEAA